MEIKYPKKFIQLTKGESPDWHSAKIGIEVKRATESKDALFLSFSKKYSNKLKSQIPTKLLEKLGFTTEPFLIDKDNNIYQQRSNDVGSITYIYDKQQKDYRLLLVMDKFREPVENNSPLIINAVRDKISKLNDHYVIYPENDVIFVMNDFIQYDLTGTLLNQMIEEYIKNIKNTYSSISLDKKFNFIYLFFYDSIIEINCESWSYNVQYITQQDWDLIKIKIEQRHE